MACLPQCVSLCMCVSRGHSGGLECACASFCVHEEVARKKKEKGGRKDTQRVMEKKTGEQEVEEDGGRDSEK